MAQHAYIKNLATGGRQTELANRLYLSVETNIIQILFLYFYWISKFSYISY